MGPALPTNPAPPYTTNEATSPTRRICVTFHTLLIGIIVALFAPGIAQAVVLERYDCIETAESTLENYHEQTTVTFENSQPETIHSKSETTASFPPEAGGPSSNSIDIPLIIGVGGLFACLLGLVVLVYRRSKSRP